MHLGIFPDTLAFGNFPDDQEFCKFQRYSGILFSQIPSHLANLPINLGIWEISRIPRHLGNFPDTQVFVKFPKFL